MGKNFKDLWIEHKDVGIVGKINLTEKGRNQCIHPFENLKIENVKNSKLVVFKFENPPKIVIFYFIKI